jgi:hypothetical protein
VFSIKHKFSPDESSSTYALGAGSIRRFRIGVKGRMNAQQKAQQKINADKMTKPVFQPKVVNKRRAIGGTIIEPIPVPAVTIPKTIQSSSFQQRKIVYYTCSNSTFFFEIISNHDNTW